MISHIKHLSQRSFARNVVIVATGTAGAQAITMAFSPIITRLYGPEAFGILGTFTAILAILVPLSSLSYPVAIVLPKRDIDAVGLAKLAMCIALVMSFLVALALIVFKELLISVFHLQAIRPYILLLPLAMLFSAALAIMSQWVIRKKLFKINAKVAVLQAAWLNGAQAGIGLFTPIAAVLVVLATLGNAMQALMLWEGVRNSSGGEMHTVSSMDKPSASIKELLWKYRDFAYYRTPQIILNAASQSMPVLMLASFFGPAAAGFYSLGKMVLSAPTALIGQSFASVFYPRINEAANNGEDSYKLILRATLYLSILGIIPFGLIIAFGPWIFDFVFGEEWHTAGVYAQWLALWSYFAFINRPSVAAIPVFSLQGIFLVYEIASIILRAVSLFLGFMLLKSALAAIVFFSLISVILNIFLIILTISTVSKYKSGNNCD